jgi:hypothetical protein
MMNFLSATSRLIRENLRKPSDFPVWIAHLYKDAPNGDALYQRERLHMANAADTWAAWCPNLLEPDAEWTENHAGRLALWASRIPPEQLIYVDDANGWENFAGNSYADPPTKDCEAIRLNVLRTLNAYHPLSGVYHGGIPYRDWYAPQAHHSKPEFSNFYADDYPVWEAKNQGNLFYAQHLNYIFPSLYIMHPVDDLEWIENYAYWNIQQAKMYNKPVIPFVWPLIHPSDDQFAFHWVNARLWSVLLTTVRTHADGVVWWDNQKTPWNLIKQTVHWRIFSDIMGIGRRRAFPFLLR